MNETKSVKVDNWGVFFLQKLQNFFNKTDYCDLTLQFQDNSQLKVHRLVLSACTDFFNVLEVQNDVSDDILVMPRDLQADVVVPIVNFMYTGTLEFEVRMYTRLLKTAMEMKMTVLLKLLEAHRRTVDQVQRNLKAKKPILLNKGASGQAQHQQQPYQRSMTTYSRGSPMGSPVIKAKQQPISQQQFTPSNIKVERSPTNVNVSIRSKKQTNIPFGSQNIPEPVQLVARYANTQSVAGQKGPSRFECSEETVTSDHFESSFDNISYESKPLITASQIKEEIDADENHHHPVVTTRYSGNSAGSGGSFEELRKGYTGAIKRPASRLTSSPPEKRSNILEDVKEYTEAHRIRKEIVAEEFKDDVDDEYSEDYLNEPSTSIDLPKSITISGGKQSGTSMTIKNEPGSVNHAKIISEVLKKYPHLVKNNKNIKLKIMQKGNTSTETIISPSSSSSVKSAGIVELPPPPVPTQILKTSPKASSVLTLPKKQIMPALKLKPSQTASTSATTNVTSIAAAAATSTSSPAPAVVTKPAGPQPKKIDSKTMHALIAQGAENMTGPWLCLKCGVRGRPISIPSYKGFRRHLINVHGQKIDPKLCEHCGWKSSRKIELHHHILVTHNIRPPYEIRFPECNDCEYIALDSTSLQRHREESHSLTNKHHCIYCNKTYSNEIQLYNHMRANHKERACEDGVMDFEDTEDEDDYTDKYILNNEHHSIVSSVGPSSGGDKIKILSNISLPAISSISTNPQSQNVNITLEPSSEAEGLSNVASGIATSLRMLDPNVPQGSGDHEDFNEQIESAAGGGNDEDEEDDGDNQANRMEEDDHYIEEAMASVHGELSNDKKETIDDDTKFVTESGSTLELTQAQKADLLQQLQDQSGVVMILNDDAFANTEEKTTADNAEAKKQGISVVYSESSSSSKKNVQNSGRKQEEKIDTEDKKKSAKPSLVDDKLEEDEKMECDNDENDDDDDGGDEENNLPKKEEKKTSSAATKKLIADWSDEEDDDDEDTFQDTADVKVEKNVSKEKLNVDEKKEPSKVAAAPAASSSSSGNKQTKITEYVRAKSKSKSPPVEEVSGGTSSGKSSPKNQDVTKKDTSDEKLTLDKKDKPKESKIVKETEKEEDEKKVDDEDSETTENKPSNSSTTTTSKKDDKILETTELISKEEIKTLINDWEDEDEDL